MFTHIARESSGHETMPQACLKLFTCQSRRSWPTVFIHVCVYVWQNIVARRKSSTIYKNCISRLCKYATADANTKAQKH
jgi:hypothetical protein